MTAGEPIGRIIERLEARILATAAQRREAAERDRHERLERYLANLPEHLAGAGVPPVLLPARLADCPDLPPRLVDDVRRWALQPSGFIVLAGRPGAGKSWLGAAAVAHILTARAEATIDQRPDGWTIRFICQTDWLATIRNNFGDIQCDAAPHGARVLIFDDLGAGYVNDLRLAELERMIRKRHASGLATLITTNLSMAELDAQLGSRVTSVLLESRNILKFPAIDLRLAAPGPPGPGGSP